MLLRKIPLLSILFISSIIFVRKEEITEEYFVFFLLDASSPHKSSNSVVPSQQPKQENGAGTSISPEAGSNPCKLLFICSLCLYVDSASSYLSRCNHFLQQKDLQEEDLTTLEWMTKSFLGFPPRMPTLLITSAIL